MSSVFIVKKSKCVLSQFIMWDTFDFMSMLQDESRWSSHSLVHLQSFKAALKRPLFLTPAVCDALFFVQKKDLHVFSVSAGLHTLSKRGPFLK